MIFCSHASRPPLKIASGPMPALMGVRLTESEAATIIRTVIQWDQRRSCTGTRRPRRLGQHHVLGGFGLGLFFALVGRTRAFFARGSDPRLREAASRRQRPEVDSESAPEWLASPVAKRPSRAVIRKSAGSKRASCTLICRQASAGDPSRHRSKVQRLAVLPYGRLRSSPMRTPLPA